MLANVIMFYKFHIFSTCLLFSLVNGTLSPKSKKSKSTEQIKSSSGPQSYTVFMKNLVGPNLTSRDILENHAAFFRETDHYNFDGMILGYVTPWNNHGYDVAKIFGNKFTHISPVWLQIKKLGLKRYEIAGVHDIDKQWMIHVKNAGRERRVKIVPRVLFEGWTLTDFKDLFMKVDEMNALTKTLLICIEKWNFDGFVFEFWTQLVRALSDDLLMNFVKTVAQKFSLNELDFILVIPPNKGIELFSKRHFEELHDYVTGFSLMTYDFSDPENPGPNAPLKWMENCIKSLTNNKNQRKKILTGLNLYGNDYSMKSRTIIAKDYLELLSSYSGKIHYDSASEEHYFIYQDSYGKHIVYYPTLYSISKRINLTEELGTGLSIWELGQGLDYFYDLL